MYSLFRRIHSLLRKGQSDAFEDLLTEVFAEIFEQQDLLVQFLEVFLGEKCGQVSGVSVSTQRTFGKLSGHGVDSRPDLTIKFSDGSQPYIIFLESKLEAGEGPDQLKRYADHLKVYQELGYRTYLLYVTRYADAKDASNIFATGQTTRLILLRWYQIYNWLTNNRNLYIDKILAFMEEIGLNDSRKFLPQDIYAIQEMSRLQRMMDESLDGVVDSTMTKLFGKPTNWTNRHVQLRDHYRYYKACPQEGCGWIGCGFYLTEEEYPLICVTFEVGPNDPKRSDTINAMKWFEKQNKEWEGYDLNDPTKWSGISSDKSLLDFLSQDDHIAAVETYLVGRLTELHAVKLRYPNLGWKA